MLRAHGHRAFWFSKVFHFNSEWGYQFYHSDLRIWLRSMREGGGGGGERGEKRKGRPGVSGYGRNREKEKSKRKKRRF